MRADLPLCVTIFSCQSAFLTTFKIKIQLQLKLFSRQHWPVLSHNMTDYAKAHMFLFIYALRKVYLIFYIVSEGNVMIFDKRWIVFGDWEKRTMWLKGEEKCVKIHVTETQGPLDNRKTPILGTLKFVKNDKRFSTINDCARTVNTAFLW